MGRRCCISSCSSTSRLPEHHGVTYHSFPLDPATRAIWMRNTRIGERQITKSVLVCSRHFRRADFQPQRSGKYLLKQRVFPTVFPWGKIDPAQVASDLEELRLASINSAAPVSGEVNKSGEVGESNPEEDATKATVEATVAQIMAETAELNAAAGIKQTRAGEGEEPTASHIKFEPVTNFSPGVRLEAQDFDGVWHAARIVEVDNDDREVLLRFERSGKTKSAVVGTEEWIPMNSTRLRQKVSSRPVPVFELEEKCLARWSGPRKFPGTVKKILGNDTYEVLFDDGYVKNVRALHMGKFGVQSPAASISSPSIASPVGPSIFSPAPPQAMQPAAATISPISTMQNTTEQDSSGHAKKRITPGSRKDWPLLDLSKLDLSTLNLPEIPHDGEWTCHWVNDQPIGVEGFLIVGEHRKPTVIVEDWRLPPGWVKHMYQRSNVLGKWDVILVSPSGKRFRSKSDLKAFLEEQGQVYNPDIYDFSIHRRRAKDINAYVFTPDYTPQQIPKSRPLDALASVAAAATPTQVHLPQSLTAVSSSTSHYMEAPVAMPLPPMELMTTTNEQPQTSPTKMAGTAVVKLEPGFDMNAGTSTSNNMPAGLNAQSTEPGCAYIGGLKVQIIDNLFRCPEEGCLKNFRKENHLQIHVKHYHKQLSKLLGDCPKMQELAEKRTHTATTTTASEAGEASQPKNQMSNQEFFAKLYQQDLQHSRTRGGAKGGAMPGGAQGTLLVEPNQNTEIKSETEIKMENLEQSFGASSSHNSTLETNSSTITATEFLAGPPPSHGEEAQAQSTPPKQLPMNISDTVVVPQTSSAAAKRSRFVHHTNKRAAGSRKSNRQRTTRRYLTAAQATSSRHGASGGVTTTAAAASTAAADGSFGVTDFEETRHSFNATPDSKLLPDSRKRKTIAGTTGTPSVSGLDSPLNATDSGSSSFQTMLAAGGELDPNAVPQQAQTQYIKENGELIKIVRMRQEEIINCICGFGEEDGLMIQCELCLCWQHGGCNGIDKESDVPDKYVCYICRNPTRGRESMLYKHDQDWLYEGTLPTANYHAKNPELSKRFEFLKTSHTLTGNLVELKRFMHSLRVKINVASNRGHPKLYLWAKKWEDDNKSNEDAKNSQQSGTSPNKRIKLETTNSPNLVVPNVPQPEAAIDPIECQQRLLEHIRLQQDRVLNRLASIEADVDELERQDDLPDLKNADISITKDVLSVFLKELDIMNDIAKINALEHMKNAANAAQTTY